MLTLIFQAGRNAVRALGEDEEGIGTLELVLIVAVLIAVVLVFREQIIEFLESLMGRVDEKSKEVFE